VKTGAANGSTSAGCQLSLEAEPAAATRRFVTPPQSRVILVSGNDRSWDRFGLAAGLLAILAGLGSLANSGGGGGAFLLGAGLIATLIAVRRIRAGNARRETTQGQDEPPSE